MIFAEQKKSYRLIHGKISARTRRADDHDISFASGLQFMRGDETEKVIHSGLILKLEPDDKRSLTVSKRFTDSIG
jgi:hypothetical protein